MTRGDARVSVIVPTFNEADNVEPLVRELRSLLPHDSGYEIIFVDDSEDSTPRVIEAVAHEPGIAVSLIHRRIGERHGGLGGAVLAGMRTSRAEIVVVMDGDLQHPPATVPRLVAALADHDVAVASRYVTDGGADGLSNVLRHVVSRASTSLTKSLFPRRLHGCSDPMTGFFALRRNRIDAESLQPMGFKILLEILARQRLRIAEVPFTFAERHAGESKASLRQGITFGWQLVNLRLGRAGRFATVGLSGLVVNLLAMAALMSGGMNYLAASVVATEIAIATNFILQERFVFADRTSHRGRLRRALTSAAFNNVEAVVRLPLLVVAVDRIGLHELTAQAVVIILAFALRFLFVSRVVYGVGQARPSPTTSERTLDRPDVDLGRPSVNEPSSMALDT